MDTEETVVRTQPPKRSFALGATLALFVTVASSVWAYVEYLGAARASLLALALAGTFFGVALTVLLGFRSTFTFQSVQAPRPTPHS